MLYSWLEILGENEEGSSSGESGEGSSEEESEGTLPACHVTSYWAHVITDNVLWGICKGDYDLGSVGLWYVTCDNVLLQKKRRRRRLQRGLT